jgi:PBP1b-binding outer membrane lipoprotein LpoB
MKYILLITILLSGCSYSKRIESLEKNQQVIVQAVNALGEKVMKEEEKK